MFQTFACNEGDVLCLSLTADGSSVFASGVEPLVTQFEFVTVQANSEWKRWVKTNVRSQHTHDVRALACTNDSLISAGKGIDQTCAKPTSRFLSDNIY